AATTGDPPADFAFALADALAGLHGTIAILAALRLRDRTGTGQYIDLSMLEAMLATDDYTHYCIDEHPVRAASGEVWPAPGGPILVSADRKYLWHQLKTCFGVADPDPDAPLEDKLRARARPRRPGTRRAHRRHPPRLDRPPRLTRAQRPALTRTMRPTLTRAGRPAPGVTSAAHGAGARPGLSPATTTMSHRGAPDHDAVTSSWSVRRPAPAASQGANAPVTRGASGLRRAGTRLTRVDTVPASPVGLERSHPCRGGSCGNSRAYRPEAHPGDRRGPGRRVQVAGI